jgi:hypothetical protein
MSIQYDVGGTRTSSTFTGDTKGNLINGIEAGMTAAGWSEITRTASVDITFQSIATPAAGNQICVRVWDDGANCVRVRLSNVAGTVVQSSSCYLLPAASKTWQIVANRYQAAIWVPGSIAARDFVIFSALYIPQSLWAGSPPLTTSAVIMGNANTDTDATIRGSMRTGLSVGGPNGTGNGFAIRNAAGMEWTSGATAIGTPTLVIPQGADTAFTTGYTWDDDSAFVSEPLVAWGTPDTTTIAKVRGQFWDGFVATESFPMDDTTTFDSHNWVNLTSNNNGAAGSMMRGSLWIATP